MKFVIEHLDPDVFAWSMLEYTHISEVVGKENLQFTNVHKNASKLKPLGEVTDKRADVVLKLGENICILDPKGKDMLVPEDAQKFDTFVFGGVLGNHPMDGRTEKELTERMPGCSVRNLGEVQMSTDTAVLVVKKIIVEQIPFEKIDFADTVEFELEDGFSTVLPYRYVVENGKVVVPKGFLEFLNSDENTF